MAIKTFNPTTPSRRNMTVLSYKGLSKVKPEKSLLEKVKKTAGRNSYGRITVRHIGGGNKKKYRIIDFKRQKLDMPATVMTLSTIRTVRPTSRSSSTRMARRPISSLRGPEDRRQGRILQGCRHQAGQLPAG